MHISSIKILFHAPIFGFFYIWVSILDAYKLISELSLYQKIKFFSLRQSSSDKILIFLLHTQVPFLLPRELYTIHSLTFISPILGAQCLQASPCFALIVLYYRADCQFHNTATQCFLPSDCLSAIILTISMGNIVVFNTIRLKPLRMMHFNSYSLMLFLVYVWLCSTACVFASSALVSVIFVRAALLLTATNIFLHMATYKLLRLFFNAITSRI